jgi:hypothetical protein
MKEKINVIQQSIAEKKEKATDLDIIVSQMMKLPYGQLKKVLTDEVMAVLEKYGYTEG